MKRSKFSEAEQLRHNFHTGSIATLRAMKACFPHLKASGQGRVVNFGSPAALLSMPPYSPAAWSSTGRVETKRYLGEGGMLFTYLTLVAAAVRLFVDAG